ncbi:MAG TPA: recombinase family protein [Caproicibacter sp.]|nr:recombinase family protein [Caproicibacter sp.]
MNPARSVTVIPSTIRMYSSNSVATAAQKRVAAYARVSTDNAEQLTSYEAQVDYYTRHIQENDEWEFVNVYTDEGISGTSTKNRDGFKHMISDALSGKIDLILTKSISRFARNTVDTLTTVRQLKEKGVEVYFEKENIHTLDSKGELFITIMSSLAQEESRSLSENVTWGQRKRFADGKVSMPYKQFLGYERGEDGSPQIVEKEAAVVRSIYQMFLDGKSPSAIARYLTAENIPTPGGKRNWQSSVVQSILTNEKYKGDAILQKGFTVDFLTKKRKVNEGEVPQYYVTNSNPAIVSREVFDLVQSELEKRKGMRYTSSSSCFSSRIICGDCGGVYGSKVWHSTSKYRRIIWQCNSKFKNGMKCTTPHFYEDELKALFVDAFNNLIAERDSIFAAYEDIIADLTDNTALEKEAQAIQGECDVVIELMRQAVNENAQSALDQADYQLRYDSLVERYENTKRYLKETNTQIANRRTKRENIEAFMQTLQAQKNLLTEFDENLWNATVDCLIVRSATEFIFRFKGTELLWKNDRKC